MTAGFFTLAGTLLGAITIGGFAFLRDRAQRAREDATRWYDARFNSYAAFLTAARDAERWGVIIAVSSVRFSREPGDHEPADFERRGWESYYAAHEELRRHRGALSLVGSHDVIVAANELEQALDDAVKAHIDEIASTPRVPGDDLTLGELLKSGLAFPKTPPPDKNVRAQANAARTRRADAFESFIAAARADLGGAFSGARRSDS